MAYKVFTAGEEALASDVNSYLMSQTVARFATAAARTSALTAPVLNQLSMVDSRPGIIQHWNGSAWVDTNRVTIGASGSYTTDATGMTTVTFPATFASTPGFVVNFAGPGTPAALYCAIGDVTTTTGRVRVLQANGTPYAGVVGLSWIVCGLVV